MHGHLNVNFITTCFFEGILNSLIIREDRARCHATAVRCNAETVTSVRLYLAHETVCELYIIIFIKKDNIPEFR